VEIGSAVRESRLLRAMIPSKMDRKNPDWFGIFMLR